jgi:hypothetical protein
VDLNADVLAIRRLRAAAALPQFFALCCVSGHKPAASANRVDGAGTRVSGDTSSAPQVRDLRGFRRLRRGFPSDACDAPLQRLAAAASFRPIPVHEATKLALAQLAISN